MEEIYPEPIEKQESIIRNVIFTPDFAKLFTGGTISLIGTSFGMIAGTFKILAITDGMPVEQQAQILAFLSFFAIIPFIILGPFSGIFVDSLNKKKLLIFADIMGIIYSGGMYISSEIWHIYLATILATVSQSIVSPARGATLPLIIKQEQLVQANSYLKTGREFSMMIGPAMAGITIALFGLQIAFVIDGVTFFVSLVLVVMLKTDLSSVGANELNFRGVMTGLEKGFRLTVFDKIMAFIAFSLGFMVLAIAQINSIFPIYLVASYGLGEQDFGFIMAVSAASGFTAGILLTMKKDIKNKLRFFMSGLLITGMATVLLGVPQLLVYPRVSLYLGMALIGVTNIVVNVPLATLLQSILNPGDIGKVSGFINTLITMFQLVGVIIATQMVLFLPFDQIFIISGVGVLIICLIGLGSISIFSLDDIANKRAEDMAVIYQELMARAKSQKVIENSSSGQPLNSVETSAESESKSLSG